MLSDQEIKEIEDRLAAASPGPWTLGFNGSMRSAWAVQKAGTASVVINLDPEKNVSLDMETHRVDGNLDLIQHSVTDLKGLVETVKELKASGTGEAELDFGATAELQVAIARLSHEVEVLKKTLYFYAHPQTYQQPTPDEKGQVTEWIGTDLGKRARRFFTPAGESERPPESTG